MTSKGYLMDIWEAGYRAGRAATSPGGGMSEQAAEALTAEIARVALIELNREKPPEQHALYQDDDPDGNYYDGADDCQHEWELRSEHDSWVCAWCQSESTYPPGEPTFPEATS